MGTWDAGPFGNDTAADFGGDLDDAAVEERAGMVRGVLLRAVRSGEYLEVLEAEGACPTSDVFPLSCLLVFAVAGHGPFGEGPGHAVAYRTLHEESDLSGLPGEPADVVRQRSAVAAAARPDTGGWW